MIQSMFICMHVVFLICVWRAPFMAPTPQPEPEKAAKKTKKQLKKEEKLEQEKKERVQEFPVIPLLALAALPVYVAHLKEFNGLKPVQAIKGYGMVLEALSLLPQLYHTASDSPSAPSSSPFLLDTFVLLRFVGVALLIGRWQLEGSFIVPQPPIAPTVRGGPAMLSAVVKGVLRPLLRMAPRKLLVRLTGVVKAVVLLPHTLKYLQRYWYLTLLAAGAGAAAFYSGQLQLLTPESALGHAGLMLTASIFWALFCAGAPGLLCMGLCLNGLYRLHNMKERGAVAVGARAEL